MEAKPRIILIGCGSSKLDAAAPASELYVGNLFRARREYAQQTGAPWAILSAKHGLVMPDRIIEPYDVRMPTRDDERYSWRMNVSSSLNQWLVRRLELATFQPPDDDHAHVWMDYAEGLSIELHAGRSYVDPITLEIDASLIRTPLAGLGIGSQLAWYAQRRRAGVATLELPTHQLELPIVADSPAA
jgi:hypothetical protein